jgi:hypothetical protein
MQQGKDVAKTHRFIVGQSVRFAAGLVERGITSQYKIVAQLPETYGDWQYRIKSVDHGRERIVKESQLSTVKAS